MNKRKKRVPLIRWAALIVGLVILVIAFQRMYSLYELHCQIREAEIRKEELLKENAELKERIEELNDPAVIERKARDDLGMVKPGEVPYVR